MQPSGKRFIGVYLLLSAGLYLGIAMLAEVNTIAETGMLCLVAGGICLAQLAFIAVVGPSRYIMPIRLWRLIIGAILTTAVLELLMYNGLVMVLVMTVRTISDNRPIGAIFLFAWALPALPMTVALCYWCRSQDRLVVFRRMVACILTVAVPAVLFAISAHLSMFVWDWAHGDAGLGVVIAEVLALFVLVWSVGPLLVWLYYRGVRRRMRGVCPACGYDLRGLSEQRCPECGQAFTFEEVHATAAELGMSGTEAARSQEAARLGPG